jgi:hypothetical protein
MAAALSLSKANVQTDAEFHGDVSVSIRQNRMVLRKRGVKDALVFENVAAVRRLERRKWLVTLENGEQLTVAQVARSCCGGR